MGEALIHIGDSAKNTWRDGDIIVVRTKDGTFSEQEKRYPFAVVPLGTLTRAIANELETTGVLYDVNGKPMPGTESNRRKYRIDWRALLAKGDGTADGKTATERDVLDGQEVKFAVQMVTVATVR